MAAGGPLLSSRGASARICSALMRSCRRPFFFRRRRVKYRRHRRSSRAGGVNQQPSLCLSAAEAISAASAAGAHLSLSPPIALFASSIVGRGVTCGVALARQLAVAASRRVIISLAIFALMHRRHRVYAGASRKPARAIMCMYVCRRIVAGRPALTVHRAKIWPRPASSMASRHRRPNGRRNITRLFHREIRVILGRPRRL